MAIRGRPAGRMTHRRRQVQAALERAVAGGQRVTFTRLAVECGLYDYREARRIVGDLRRLAMA